MATDSLDAADSRASDLSRLLAQVVARRVGNAQDREDIVQEALTRTLAARPRLAEDVLAPYAVTVARNLVAAHYARHDVQKRHQPRLIDLTEAARPDELVVRAEDAAALRTAIANLPAGEREVLLGHVADGQDMATLAAATGSTPGGVAARLARARARARVDYVLALRRRQLLDPQCRPVLLAVSAGDRRRQDALDAAGHLARCAVCPELVPPLTERRSVLAGVVPLPLLVLLGRLRQQGAPAQAAAAAAGVAVAAGGVALVLSHGPPPAGPARTPAAAAAPAAAASPATPAGAPASPQPRPPARTSVSLTGTVTDVAAPYGFWLRADGREHYVHFTGLPARPVRLGDTASVVGRPTPVSSALLRDRDAVPARGQERLRAAGTYVEASARAIRLRP